MAKRSMKNLIPLAEKSTQRPPPSEGRVLELIDDVVRKAISEQARDLEKHLGNIHKRLVAVEKK